MITIAGGTGTVGRKLTKTLLREGTAVRVLTRDPARAASVFGDGAHLEIVRVDFDDPSTLRSAFATTGTAFLSMGTSETQVRDEKALIDAAVAADVPYLVNLSSSGAGGTTTSNVNKWHTEIDAYISTKDVASTILRPTTYVDTIVRVASSFVPADAWGGHAGYGRGAFIDSRDVADVAALVLREGAGKHAGSIYALSGPAPVTMHEIADQLSAGLGTRVEYHDRTEAEQRAVLESAGLSPLRVQVLLGLDDLIRDKAEAAPSPVIPELTGRPARSAADYITENLSLFVLSGSARG
jgi:NAD(P)H dehydrogenase (quinone)